MTLALAAGCATAEDDATEGDELDEAALAGSGSGSGEIMPFPGGDAVVIHDANNFPFAAGLVFSDKPGLCARLQANRTVKGERRLSFELGRAGSQPAPDENPYVLPLTVGVHTTVAHSETSAGPYVGRWAIGTRTRFDNGCNPTGTFADGAVHAGGTVYLSYLALPPPSGQKVATRGGYSVRVGSGTGTRQASLFTSVTYCPIDVFAEPPAPTCVP